jgi:hypothetical protein
MPKVSLQECYLTALRAITGEPATKRHVWQDGVWETTSYSGGQYFEWAQVEVDSLDSLSAHLGAIEEKPDWFVVRGEPLRRAKYLRRVYKGDNPYFEPVDRQWLCIDIDGLEVPEGKGHVEYAISRLPRYFHDVSCHWQHSSSAGIKGERTANLHLWYWLDRPVCDFSLREWSKGLRDDSGLPIDSMLYNPVQPHYTALPIIEGAPDPIEERSGLLRADKDELTLPADVINLKAWVTAWRKKREEDQARRRAAARRARMNPQAPGRRRAYALTALNSACVKIESATDGDRHRTIFAQSAAVAELFDYIDENLARAQLENAARIAIGDEGRVQEALRTVSQGIEAGRKSPRDLSHIGALDADRKPAAVDANEEDDWLTRPAITCEKYESTAGGCAHYLDGGACARDDEFMCTEWLKLNPAHSGTDISPRANWSSSE